jgi:hypothetical protein
MFQFLFTKNEGQENLKGNGEHILYPFKISWWNKKNLELPISMNVGILAPTQI